MSILSISQKVVKLKDMATKLSTTTPLSISQKIEDALNINVLESSTIKPNIKQKVKYIRDVNKPTSRDNQSALRTKKQS